MKNKKEKFNIVKLVLTLIGNSKLMYLICLLYLIDFVYLTIFCDNLIPKEEGLFIIYFYIFAMAIIFFYDKNLRLKNENC